MNGPPVAPADQSNRGALCPLGRLSRLEISDHIAGMGGRIRYFIATVDAPVGIDQVGVTHRVVREIVVRRPNDLVLRAHGAIDVAQQTEGKALGLGEYQVVSGCVERGAEDDGIELFEAMGTVTQALALDRSTTCRGFRVPPQQHPMTAEILEMDVCAVLVRQFEVRCN